MTPPLTEVLAAVAAMDADEAYFVGKPDPSGRASKSKANAISACLAYCRTLKPAVELPELPEPQGTMNWTREAGVIIGKPEDGYTAEQMLAYGEACRTLKPGSVVVPDGWQLVPVDATQEMRMAWDSVGDDYRFHDAYAAMLAAAQPPAQGDE